MNQDTELVLIDELLELKSSGTAFLDKTAGTNPMLHYTSDDHFRQEQDKILSRLPVVAAHSSELEQAGAFVQRKISGSPVLITRDRSGQVHAFLNVCRHRGTRLVNAESGCKHRFSCPYHAWTYANTGELVAAPHFEQGFPNEQKSALGLERLSCHERYGFIWVVPNGQSNVDIDEYLDDLGADLKRLAIGDMMIAVEHTETRKANWKILVEGGIEAYHFRVAHRNTIGPYFENNLSSYRCFGPHLRSILPRTSLADSAEQKPAQLRLRDHANILYTLFPTSQLLVQQDHIVWISQQPISAYETRLRLVTLVPKTDQQNQAHWQHNHAITSATLVEDFDIAESIQGNADSGANDNMLFGRFEGALDKFNQTIAKYLNSEQV